MIEIGLHLYKFTPKLSTSNINLGMAKILMFTDVRGKIRHGHRAGS